MQQTTFRAMGSRVLVVLDHKDSAPLAAVPDWFAAWEQTLSRFRPDSELMRLNAQPGGWVQVSDTLWQVLQAARDAARMSGGLVTPTVLPALAAAGYDRSLEALPSAHPPVEFATVPVPDWRAIRCDPQQRAVWLPHNTQLDLGGVVKGWAAAQAAQRLASYGPVLVDAGGDIAISGPRRDGTPWPIAVANPHRPDCDDALLLIRAGGVATSGTDYRRWQQGERWQHHLIDPATGAPACTDLLSVTVVAPSLLTAETVAKAVLLKGSRAGLAWLEQQPVLAGLLITIDGQVTHSRRLSASLWKET
jgi:thiamine biosynthesis lipoprotein